MADIIVGIDPGLFGDAVDMPTHLMASAMPGQGVTGMFAFGKTYGIVLGVLSALEIPTTLVARRVGSAPWVSLEASTGRARASQLIPGAAHQWRLAKDHGRAEAALLALYGTRQLGPTLSSAEKPMERRGGIPAPSTAINQRSIGWQI